MTNMRKAKSLGPEAVNQLEEIFDRVVNERPRAVVLESQAPQFCAGFDLADMNVGGDGELRERFTKIQTLLSRLQTLPVLTVAVVDGAAIGAGADLAAACDIRVGTARARFQFPGSRFGLVLGTQRLAHIVSATGFIDLAVRVRRVPGEAALDYGLLTHLLDSDEVDGWLTHLRTVLETQSPMLLDVQRRLMRGEDVGSA